MDAIGGAREAEATALGEIAAGEEHPVIAVDSSRRLVRRRRLHRRNRADRERGSGSNAFSPIRFHRLNGLGRCVVAVAVRGRGRDNTCRSTGRCGSRRDRPRRVRPSYRMGQGRAPASPLFERLDEYRKWVTPRAKPVVASPFGRDRCSRRFGVRLDTNTRARHDAPEPNRWPRCIRLPRAVNRAKRPSLGIASWAPSV